MRKLFATKEVYLLLFIIAVVIGVTAVNRTFLTVENLFDLLKVYSVWGIFAMGLLVVLISGGIDVSFMAVATAAGYIASKYMIIFGGNFIISFAIVCVVGIVLGAINGLVVSQFRLPAIVATLCTMAVFRGMFFVITKGVWIYHLPEWFRQFGARTFFNSRAAGGVGHGLPVQLVVWGGISLVTWLLLRYVFIGRAIHAVGGNPEAASRVGVRVTFIQVFVYCYMGLTAGIAGLMQTAMVGVTDPRALMGSELSVIAAVLLGGASVAGGAGSVLGTFLGVTLLAITSNALVLMQVSSYWQKVLVGLILIMSMVVQAVQRSRAQRRTLLVETALGKGQ